MARGVLAAEAGDRFALGAVSHGRESSLRTSTDGYDVWYEIESESGASGWAQAAVPSSFDTGPDGRSSLRGRLAG